MGGAEEYFRLLLPLHQVVESTEHVSDQIYTLTSCFIQTNQVQRST